jgi:hypothetical protein
MKNILVGGVAGSVVGYVLATLWEGGHKGQAVALAIVCGVSILNTLLKPLRR